MYFNSILSFPLPVLLCPVSRVTCVLAMLDSPKISRSAFHVTLSGCTLMHFPHYLPVVCLSPLVEPEFCGPSSVPGTQRSSSITSCWLHTFSERVGCRKKKAFLTLVLEHLRIFPGSPTQQEFMGVLYGAWHHNSLLLKPPTLSFFCLM